MECMGNIFWKYTKGTYTRNVYLDFKGKYIGNMQKVYTDYRENINIGNYPMARDGDCRDRGPLVAEELHPSRN